MSVDIDSNEKEETENLTYEQWENIVNRQQSKKIKLQKFVYWIFIKMAI